MVSGSAFFSTCTPEPPCMVSLHDRHFAFLDITTQAHRCMKTIGLAIRLKKRGKAANGGNAAELSRPRVRVQAESLYAQGAICGTLTVSNGQ